MIVAFIGFRMLFPQQKAIDSPEAKSKSGAIMRLVGKGGIEAISRLMGFLLVCMGVQFIINGILEIIKTYH